MFRPAPGIKSIKREGPANPPAAPLDRGLVPRRGEALAFPPRAC